MVKKYILSIDSDEVFKLKGAVAGYGKDGGTSLYCNYVKSGDDITITLEGEGKLDTMSISKELTYAQFKRKYPEHKVYLQGYVEVKNGVQSKESI